MKLQRHGWRNFEFPRCAQELKKAFSANPPAMIEQLLEKTGGALRRLRFWLLFRLNRSFVERRLDLSYHFQRVILLRGFPLRRLFGAFNFERRIFK